MINPILASSARRRTQARYAGIRKQFAITQAAGPARHTASNPIRGTSQMATPPRATISNTPETTARLE